MISPAASLTRGRLFRGAVQSGAVRCSLSVSLHLLLNILNSTSAEDQLKDGSGVGVLINPIKICTDCCH